MRALKMPNMAFLGTFLISISPLALGANFSTLPGMRPVPHQPPTDFESSISFPVEAGNPGVDFDPWWLRPEMFGPALPPTVRSRVTPVVPPVGTPTVPAAPTPADLVSFPETMDLNSLSLNNLARLNKMDSISNFIEFFGLEAPKEEDDLALFSRVGGTDMRERAVVEEAQHAKCEPEMRTVELNLPNELNTVFYPTCTRLPRCGGCCYGTLFSCQPSKTEPVRLKVLKIKQARSSSRVSIRRRRRRNNQQEYHTVYEVKHTACDCKCRVQEHHCNANLHEYKEDECACKCLNRDEEQKCSSMMRTHYWNNTLCQCFCRRTQECSTGQVFSHSSCSCETSLTRRAISVPVGGEDPFVISSADDDRGSVNHLWDRSGNIDRSFPDRRILARRPIRVLL